MIERKFVAQRKKEFQIHEYVGDFLESVGHSSTRLVKTPLGEKIIVHASRPGLIVGRKGANIKQLTKMVKGKFNLENPEVEISEVENIYLDANIVAERIVNALERFGSHKFKAVGHKIMAEVMGSGAYGIEILISGKVPSSRARRWRFYSGYLKKSGDVSIIGVKKAIHQARLKTGVIGIQVKIMPPDTKLPDNIRVLQEVGVEQIEVKGEEPSAKKEEKSEEKEEVKEEKTEKKKKKTARKKAPAKKKKATKKKQEKVKEESTEEPKDENQGD